MPHRRVRGGARKLARGLLLADGLAAPAASVGTGAGHIPRVILDVIARARFSRERENDRAKKIAPCLAIRAVSFPLRRRF
jgi:hypothetical protein